MYTCVHSVDIFLYSIPASAFLVTSKSIAFGKSLPFILRLILFIIPFFQALRNFSLILEVPNRYHPEIIGRRGVVVNDIRKKHDVKIQFPEKSDQNSVSHMIIEREQ